MSASPSPRVTAYAALAAILLFTALALRRPELAVLALPFALPPALGLRLARAPEVRLDAVLERATAVEGDELALELEASSLAPVERLELLVVVPDGLTVVSGPAAQSLRLGWEDSRTLTLRLRCERWGNYDLGDVRLRARDRLGLLVWESAPRLDARLRVYPTPETLRQIVRPSATQLFTGSEVARQKGEGLEFADVREFVPGDRVRAINWRASARRGTLVVNERHPERNADVILFLDTFSEARTGEGSTLDRAVRATATLASRYLERRDRVGLVSFGGLLSWLTPGMGETQRYRIVDALLESQVVFNYAWKDVSTIPSRVLPAAGLVVAVSPLLDDRVVDVLADLRARRYDLVVVEVSALDYSVPGASETEALAHRLWLLRREEIRARFEALGVAVATWDDERPLEAALEGVRAFRRHAQIARG